MGRLSQLETAGLNAFDQSWVRSLHPWHHNSDINDIEQGKIVGGVAEAENLNVSAVLMLFESIQRSAFADALAKQMGHAVSLNHGEALLLNQGEQAIPC